MLSSPRTANHPGVWCQTALPFTSPSKHKTLVWHFIQCWINVEDVGPALYKCYANVLCLLGRPSSTHHSKAFVRLMSDGDAYLERRLFLEFTHLNVWVAVASDTLNWVNCENNQRSKWAFSLSFSSVNDSLSCVWYFIALLARHYFKTASSACRIPAEATVVRPDWPPRRAGHETLPFFKLKNSLYSSHLRLAITIQVTSNWQINIIKTNLN